MENVRVPYNGFAWLGQELRRRIVRPSRHLSFWTMLVGGVAFFGGFGIWLECAKHYFLLDDNSHAIRTALVTFAPAIAGFTSLQIIADREAKQQWRLLGGLCIAFLAAISAWLIFDHSMPSARGLAYSIAFALIAVGIWWVGNADQAFVEDETDPEAAVGGSTGSPPVGDLEDFKH